MSKDYKKHLSVAFYGFRSGPGGVNPVIANLMAHIAHCGYPVHLLIDESSPPDYSGISSDIRVINIQDGSRGKTIASLSKYFFQHRPVALLANKERAARVAIKTSQKARFPVRIALRVGTNNIVSIRRRHILQQWLRRGMLQRYYHRLDAIIAVSEGVAKDTARVTGIPKEQIHVIHNPTIPPDLKERIEAPVDHAWLVSKDLPVILGIGRLTRSKDFSTLIHAFAEVREKRPCRLMILGEGKLRIALEALVKRLGITADVDLPGFVNNPFAYLARSDLFVLSSVWEGSPNVLIEALAVGIPVVSTDCSFGPREILDNGRYGPLVPVGDVGTMAAKMIERLDQPSTSDHLKSAVRMYRPEHSTPYYLKALRVDF